MTCDQFRQISIERLAGEAGAAEWREAERHAAGCPTCREEPARFELLWAELKRWPDEKPSSDARERFLRMLDESDSRPAVTPAQTAVTGRWRWTGFFPQAMAASVILCLGLLGGVVANRVWQQPEGSASAIPRGKHQYMLLLYTRTGQPGPTPDEERAIVDEYKTWARDLAARGLLTGGEKLTDDRWLIPDSETGGPSAEVPLGMELGGYFVIVATTDDEARIIAESCPHRLRGGLIELRKIDPV